MTSSDNPFAMYADRYDDWFVRNAAVYQSEVDALRTVMSPLPPAGYSLEVGTGTGRFSIPLGITHGVEPAAAMRRIAQARGVRVIEGVGENLPFDRGTFDLVLLVTTICFVADPRRCLDEAHRVLKRGGQLAIGFVDSKSDLGMYYEQRRATSPFYRDATFYSVADIERLLTASGFRACRYGQTLFGPLKDITVPESVVEGHGEGGFVAVAAEKERSGDDR